MRTIIDAMRTDQAVAVWRAASAALAAKDGDAREASNEILSMVGFGLTVDEADLIDHHIDVLNRERQDACFHLGTHLGETCATCGKDF